MDINSENLKWFDSCRSRVIDPFGLEAADSIPPHDPSKVTLVQLAQLKQKVVQTYESLMQQNGLVDFAGVMILALRHVEAGHEIFQSDHILVDEAQDVDELQLKLIMAHADFGARIDLVGDDDQSVYSFRQGMGFTGLDRFTKELRAIPFVLSLNFRCKEEILEWAGKIIEQNIKRIPKELVASRGRGGQIKLMHWSTENQQLKGVALLVLKAIASGVNSVAIIARQNALLVDIQAPLTGLVEFKRINCDSFWELRPAAVALALLRCIADPECEIAGGEEFLYWCQTPAKDIELLRLTATTSTLELCLQEGVEDVLELSNIGRSAVRWLRYILNETGFPSLFANDRDAGEIIRIVFEGCCDAICFCGTKTEAQIDAELNILQAASASLMTMSGSLASRIRKVTMADRKDRTAKVTLVSMHSSKGKQFQSVFVIGAEDQRIPGRAESNSEIEEERRLLYVAMTRAQDCLTITYAKKYRKGKGYKPTFLTRFLDEPHAFIQDEDAMPE